MKRIVIPFLFSLFILTNLSAFAQDKFIVSIKTQDDIHSGQPEIKSVIQSSDGGYIATGFAYIISKNIGDLFITKLDEQGNMIWTKAMGTANSDYGIKIIGTSDGGFTIGGQIDNKAALCKFDNNGNLEWLKQYNQNFDGNGTALIQTQDNGYLFAVLLRQNADYSLSYAYLIKTDSSGNIQWTKRYYSNWGIDDVKSTQDGNYIFTGHYGDIVKINSVGDILWSKRFTNSDFSAILPTSDGNTVLTGSKAIIKLDKNGNLLWSKSFTGEDGYGFPLLSVFETPSNDYVFAGAGYENVGGLAKYYAGLVTLKASGILKQTKKIKGIGGYMALNELIETIDGGYLAAGNKDTSAGFFKFDSSFNTCINTPKFGQIEDYGSLDTTEVSTGTDNITITTETVEITSAGTATFQCGDLLPLNLLSFSAQRNGNTNLLKWSSTNEINTDRFEIQRSSNGRDFTTIASVQSYNTGKSKNDYSFTDGQPLKAVNYYRLKMVDKDGKYTFSAIRSINNTNSFDVTLYPNPVKNNLTLNFSSEKATDLQIEIVSTEGKLVLSKKIQIAQNESKQTINTASLNAGNYFLKCTSAKGEVALRFVKQQ